MAAKQEKWNPKFFQVLIEIGIITIGILIAYQLNTWKEIRATNDAQEQMLKEIKANLELDLIDLGENSFGHQSALSLIDSLKMIAPTNVYTNKIPQMIRHALRDYIFNAQTSAFETLKSKGVHLISNDSIRIRLLRLYDFSYSTIEKVEESYKPNQFTKHYDHIVLNYFQGFDLTQPESIEPLYKGTDWLLNADIINRLDLTKAEHLFCLSLYESNIDEVTDLIKTIEIELENEF